MMKAVNSVFVDTNILVYSTNEFSPLNVRSRMMLDDLFITTRELCISRQIIREYLSTMTRPSTFTPVPNVEEVLESSQRIAVLFRVLEDSSLITNKLFDLLRSIPCGGKQIHDANIVATMLAHGIPKLLTHNVADFKRFSKLIEVVPLLA